MNASRGEDVDALPLLIRFLSSFRLASLLNVLARFFEFVFDCVVVDGSGAIELVEQDDDLNGILNQIIRKRVTYMLLEMIDD